ncbi:hypothetical protein BDF14DRAFT_1692667, partial [Spinellus fusiger]
HSVVSYSSVSSCFSHSAVSRDSSQSPTQETDAMRCWICFGEEEDSQGRWIHPCQCSLVSHEECLLAWIQETHESKSIPLVLLALMEKTVHTTASIVAVLGIGCSVLMVSTTYGALTVMTMMGEQQGQNMIGHPLQWSWKTWMGLPAIPLALVVSRSPWGDNLLPIASTFFLRLSPSQPRWPPSPAIVLGMLPWI